MRLWGGRFEGGPADALARLSVSVQFDWRLAPYDLLASRAHARVLHRAGLLTDDELRPHARRARRPGAGLPDGRVPARPSPTRTCTPRWSAACWSGSARSAASCAPAAAATTRSPPTCGSTCATTSGTIVSRLVELETALIDQAEQHVDTAAPGMTHLQHAQPVLVRPPAARARAAARPRRRPAARLGPARRGLARSAPARSPARRCRSTRRRSPHELGFDSAAPNSMDAVADRDFAAEFLFAAALIGVHLSRLGEEIVLWASQEFRWIEMDDAYATGSSIMPQKKNPDVAELARGKAGRLIGHLVGAAHHAQGPAADLQPRPAGGQGAGLRRGRHAAAGPARRWPA